MEASRNTVVVVDYYCRFVSLTIDVPEMEASRNTVVVVDYHVLISCSPQQSSCKMGLKYCKFLKFMCCLNNSQIRIHFFHSVNFKIKITM
jgi:hypothetical protein